MKYSPKIKIRIKLIASILGSTMLFFFAWLRLNSIESHLTSEEFNQKVDFTLSQKKKFLTQSTDKIISKIKEGKGDSLFMIFDNESIAKLDDENCHISVLKNDTLIYWTSNNVPNVISFLNRNSNVNRIGKNLNGWYYFYNEKCANFTIVGTIKLKNEFTVENDFLVNNFILFNEKNTEVQISLDPKFSPSKILDIDKVFLFSYKLLDKKVDPVTDLTAFLLIVFSFYFSLITLKKILFQLPITKQKSSLLFIIICLVTRFYMLFGEVFLFWNLHAFFNPNSFALSAINPSIGDFLLNVLFLYFFIKTLFENHSFSFLKRISIRFRLVFSLLLIIVLSFVFTKYVSVLVTDSNINYNFNNFFELDSITFVSIAIIGVISYIYYSISSFLSASITTQISIKEISTLVISLLLIWMILLFTQYNLAASNFFFIAVLLLLYYVFNHSSFINTKYSKVVFIISVFAVWSSIIINNQLVHKKEQIAKLLSEKLAVEKDVVAENLFSEISVKIKSDSLLSLYLFNNDKHKQQFFKRLTESYFNGYWDKFQTRVYVYDAKCNQVAKSLNANDEKLNVFEDVCNKKELESSARSLYYIPNEDDEDAGLLCKFIFNKSISNISNPLTVYIQFTIKYNADEIGFPSLLLDKKFGQSKEQFQDFSFAKYRLGLLIPINKFNSYNYPLTSSFINTDIIKNQMLLNNGYFNYNEFRHYYYKPYKTSAFIVSFKNLNFFEKLTSSSYLFVFYMLLFLVKSSLSNSIFLFGPFFDSLNKKIRLVLITSVFSGLLVIASVTAYFLISHFNEDKNEKITQNIQSLLIELENKFGDENELINTNTEFYNYLLSKSSNLFFNDINLYNLDGNLIASSRFKIFDEGILSNKINPLALKSLKYKSDAQFVNSENIGNLNYISVYIPFVNNKNKLIGYVHLPFFDKENILRKEIFNLSATILNLYLILFVFIAVIAWWITNKITFPLTVLKQRFANIDLNKRNEVINWQANDEIGSVVKEYNNMVLQLNDSVMKLAQNERELAWREMAKQVAHEIKNPLTPMKLNVQLLQRNINLDEKSFKEKFAKVSDSLVLQIDTLANIANDFSNFAQITKNNPESVNLVDVVKNVISLYDGEAKLEFEFLCESAQVNLFIDKDHILRILNNLVKNAVQAESDSAIKKITIALQNQNDFLLLSVADNGNGIPDDLKDKIFKPYFTTKSSGSGLGLAMIHQIVESMGGQIYFEDLQPHGTKFSIKFKKSDI